MFPCHVTPWPSAEAPAPCGNHAPSVQPSQALPDLLCSCPAPNIHSETPSPDPMESLIVVTEYEPTEPLGEPEEEEVAWKRLKKTKINKSNVFLILNKTRFLLYLKIMDNIYNNTHSLNFFSIYNYKKYIYARLHNTSCQTQVFFIQSLYISYF